MKRHFLLFVICFLIVSGCRAPYAAYVGFFEADGYIRPFEESFNDTITFVFDQGVRDEFMLEEMNVHQFRKSLKFSFYYTFINSFKEVNFSDKIDSSGICVVLYRVRPGFELKSVISSTYGSEDYVNTVHSYDLTMLVRYDGIIYKDGMKVLAMDNEVMSEKSTFQNERPDVFRDGVKEMCEGIYKEVLKAEPIGFR